MKNAFVLSGITALITAGSVFCAAEPPPPKEIQPPPAHEGRQEFLVCRPQFGKRDDRRDPQGCPMMRREKSFERGLPIGKNEFHHEMNPFAMRHGKRHFGGFGLIPRCPMNEDEMAKFFDLGQSLRSAVENLVTASQQHEIERCEKALARAKAAVARKDQIVERQMKKLMRATLPITERSARNHQPPHQTPAPAAAK